MAELATAERRANALVGCRRVDRGNAIDLAERAIWIGLRDDGRWWTVAELLHHWLPTFRRIEMDASLRALHGAGYAECRCNEGGHLEYAVTDRCAALPGLEAATAQLPSEAQR